MSQLWPDGTQAMIVVWKLATGHTLLGKHSHSGNNVFVSNVNRDHQNKRNIQWCHIMTNQKNLENVLGADPKFFLHWFFFFFCLEIHVACNKIVGGGGEGGGKKKKKNLLEIAWNAFLNKNGGKKKFFFF